MLIGFDLAAAASVHVSSAAAQILVSANTAAAAWVFFTGYFAGLPVAIILTGITLWRSQAIPRWLPVLFVVALIAGALAPPGIISVPFSLPFVIVMMLLARRIWDTAPSGSHASIGRRCRDGMLTPPDSSEDVLVSVLARRWPGPRSGE